MKRLLKISFDLSLLSFIPIISWFLLGIIVDKNLINIFTLTYPLQFIYYILRSIFSTGANITKEKDNNKNAVMSGMIIGTIVVIVIFSIILINIDNYINFMNMDIHTYKVFAIYSVLQLDIIKCIKYDSAELFDSIACFLIFLFGLSNALEFGEQFTIALTFISLITDTQWDTVDSIVTVATIDISKNSFNYKEHIRNAYKLLGILFLTSLFMFICLYGFYDLNFKITIIYFVFEIINFIIYPMYRIKTCYLQLEWSSFKTTSNKICASIFRMIMSFLKTPFCTGIGQVCSSIYQLISVSLFFKLNYNIDNSGKITSKKLMNH